MCEELSEVGRDGGTSVEMDADSEDAEQMERADSTCSDVDHSEDGEQRVGNVSKTDFLNWLKRMEKTLNDTLDRGKT